MSTCFLLLLHAKTLPNMHTALHTTWLADPLARLRGATKQMHHEANTKVAHVQPKFSIKQMQQLPLSAQCSTQLLTTIQGLELPRTYSSSKWQ